MRLEKLKPLTDEYLESIGFVWHTDSDNSSYISDEIVVINEDEANAYYDAVNELYDMFAEAGQYVIDNDLFHELNIPFNLVEIIKESWENDVHWHLYSSRLSSSDTPKRFNDMILSILSLTPKLFYRR